ncbi:Gfo/Idh/MocA family protein [Planctomycetota bacterium]
MDTVKWGLIGCGDIANKRVAPALRELSNCELLAVNRKRFELAREFADKFGAKKCYKTWQELLGDEKIEAVYIATPINLHCEQTIAAANAGKHVLCEKPMALNPGQCDRMIEACNVNNVKLGIAYYRHFYPIIERIKQILRSGQIGRPIIAQINAFEYFDPPADSHRRWFLKKAESGGGPMFDFGCHRIEVLLNLFGKTKSVNGFVDNIFFDREVEDTCTAHIAFESGLRAVLNVSHAIFESQDSLDIFGTEGSLHVPKLNGAGLTVITAEKKWTQQHRRADNLHRPLIEDFARAVLENKDPVVNGTIGKEVALIEQRVYADDAGN